MPAGKTLLMVAFEFPPLRGIGVQRSFKLAKYLPEHGVRPIVVTTDSPSLEAWFGGPLNWDILDELPREVAIHRVPCPRQQQPSSIRWVQWLRFLLSTGEDLRRAWEPSLAQAWDRLVAEFRPDAAYVSIPPFNIGPLVVKLAHRSRLPLIVDFRDHWSQWCHGAKTTWLHYQVQKRRERLCLQGASAVVGVTRQLIRDLQAVHGAIATEKFRVVANGFDAALVPSLQRGNPASSSKPFVIGYVGSFYYSPQARASVMDPWWQRPPHRWLHYVPRREDWLYRSPFFFFRALGAVLDSRPELRSAVRVRFAGEPQDWLESQIRHFGLTDVVEHLGYLSHRACVDFQASCDALLLTSVKVVGGRDYCIAGKTFEYLAAGKPIIAFVTEGEQQEFLLESGVAVVCDADDPTASARTLERLLLGGYSLAPNLPFLNRFHRRETSRQMAELVGQVAGTVRPYPDRVDRSDPGNPSHAPGSRLETESAKSSPGRE